MSVPLDIWLTSCRDSSLGAPSIFPAAQALPILMALLTLPITQRLFFEPFAGGAIHNGSLTPTPTLSGLGCPVLFHAGVSVGVPITEHWRVLGSFEHLSNGKGFGVNCGTNQSPSGSNQGLNNYGLSASYAF
jgi:hypothetical protein